MPGQTTTLRLHIFCPLAARQLVNDTLRYVDPTSDGGDVVAAPLVLIGTTEVVAVGASWAMEDTTDRALRAAVRQAGWQPRMTTLEQTTWTASTLAQVPAWGSQRLWLFQGPHWDPALATPEDVSYEQALAVLGLAPPPSDRP